MDEENLPTEVDLALLHVCHEHLGVALQEFLIARRELESITEQLEDELSATDDDRPSVLLETVTKLSTDLTDVLGAAYDTIPGVPSREEAEEFLKKGEEVRRFFQAISFGQPEDEDDEKTDEV